MFKHGKLIMLGIVGISAWLGIVYIALHFVIKYW